MSGRERVWCEAFDEEHESVMWEHGFQRKLSRVMSSKKVRGRVGWDRECSEFKWR